MAIQISPAAHSVVLAPVLRNIDGVRTGKRSYFLAPTFSPLDPCFVFDIAGHLDLIRVTSFTEEISVETSFVRWSDEDSRLLRTAWSRRCAQAQGMQDTLSRFPPFEHRGHDQV